MNARVGYRWTLLGPPPSQIHLHFSFWCGRTDFSQRDQMLVLHFSTLDPSCQNFSLSPTIDLGGVHLVAFDLFRFIFIP